MKWQPVIGALSSSFTGIRNHKSKPCSTAVFDSAVFNINIAMRVTVALPFPTNYPWLLLDIVWLGFCNLSNTKYLKISVHCYFFILISLKINSCAVLSIVLIDIISVGVNPKMFLFVWCVYSQSWAILLLGLWFQIILWLYNNVLYCIDKRDISYDMIHYRYLLL